MEDEFAGLFHRVKVAHHIPERIRLKLDLGAAGALAASWAQAEALLEQLRRTRGVRSVMVNAIARSCLIEYDRSIINPTAWVDLVEGKMTEEVRMFRSSFRDARANEIAKQ